MLTKTQVNTSSVEKLGEYIFFSGNDIQPGKSDREHEWVGIVTHRRLQPFLFEIKQTNGKLMAMRLRSLGANMAFICGYAPHNRHLTETKEALHDSLQDLLNECNEFVSIGGDFNAGLHHRYTSEHDIIGVHTFGRGKQYLELVAHTPLENGNLFVDVGGPNSLRVFNTVTSRLPNKPRFAKILHQYGMLSHLQHMLNLTSG